MSIVLDGSGGISSTGGIDAADLTGTLPAISGASLTGVLKPASSLTAANLTGALPAIDGSSLTGIESGPTYGTPVATTSGTSFDFTGIPAGVSEVTLHLADCGESGGYGMTVVLGTSSGFQETGYVGNSAHLRASAVSEENHTVQFGIKSYANPTWGRMTFTRADTSSNDWTQSLLAGNTSDLLVGSGGVTLGGELTQIRLRADVIIANIVFNSGTANISWSF